MEPVIQIRNLSKRYSLGEEQHMYGNLRESFVEVLKYPLRRSKAWKQIRQRNRDDSAFWALRDISFDVQRGETIGILGSNGAGKSTLLKILSRITDPTEGSVNIQGQLASLLEVGTGFHPELTGRENIFLNAAILGMSRKEIQSQFDDIVNFAGIGQFLDTPVKRYSSGMYVRLAFSIAAHLDPEILIVDEVLAVGDVAFQKKCLGKMAEACSRARTVIFVSHNLAAVENLCTRCIVLHHGSMVFAGKTRDAIDFYLSHIGESENDKMSHEVDLGAAPGRPTKYHPALRKLQLFHPGGTPLSGGLAAGAGLRAIVEFELASRCTSFDVSVAFDTPSGQRLCTAHSAYEPERVHGEKFGAQAFTCEIPSLPLIPGDYKIGVGLDIGGAEADWVDDATRLKVIKSDFYGTGIAPTKGAFLIPNRWHLGAPASIPVALQRLA